jgi:WD40 repeat protein
MSVSSNGDEQATSIGSKKFLTKYSSVSLTLSLGELGRIKPNNKSNNNNSTAFIETNTHNKSTMASFGSPPPTATGKASMIAPEDCIVPESGTDSTSSLVWSPVQNQNYLVSGNWDGGVRCWEAGATGQSAQSGQAPVPAVAARAMAKVTHENNAPVLDVCFSADGSTVFSVGADKAVRMWSLGQSPPNGIPPQIGAHDAPIKSVGFLPSSNLVVSGGWDRKLKFWDTRR